jgi:hypothetical protein
MNRNQARRKRYAREHRISRGKGGASGPDTFNPDHWMFTVCSCVESGTAPIAWIDLEHRIITCEHHKDPRNVRTLDDVVPVCPFCAVETVNRNQALFPAESKAIEIEPALQQTIAESTAQPLASVRSAWNARAASHSASHNHRPRTQPGSGKKPDPPMRL